MRLILALLNKLIPGFFFYALITIYSIGSCQIFGFTLIANNYTSVMKRCLTTIEISFNLFV